ncbi:mask [Symbiodinium natans]|uniref:Mask protein n=1 Tax=Symbiodinium natans TaxID=878477 RepID=A0A812PVR7_9DINO|nr:mask [Symbiodinium natans]
MLRVWKPSGEEVLALPQEEVDDVRSLKRRLRGPSGTPRFRQRLLSDGQALEDAASLQGLTDLQLILLPFLPAEQKDADRLTSAVKDGLLEVVEDLLQRPQDPNLPNGIGATPLCTACEHGHLEIARLLLEADANIEKISGPRSRTPLRMACEMGHLELARLMVEAGADKDKVSGRDVRSPLGMATERGHIEVVRFLLQAGADKDAKYDSYRPAAVASRCRHYEVVRLFHGGL